MNYVLLICWLLLFFIPPTEKIHYLLAFTVVLCIIINTVVITEIYNQNYVKSELDSLNYTSYVIYAVYIVLFVLFFCIVILGQGRVRLGSNIYNSISNLTGVFEIIGIIIFGIFIAFFSQMPPLPNNGNLVCSYK